jgi:hypothetical protein
MRIRAGKSVGLFTIKVLSLGVLGSLYPLCIEGEKNTREGLNCVNFFFFNSLSVWLMTRVLISSGKKKKT